MNYKGTPVKASRLFAGYEHEQETKRIAQHFGVGNSSFKTVKYNPEYIAKLKAKLTQGDDIKFAGRDLSVFENSTEAYHQLMMDIVRQQEKSTKLAIQDSGVRRIFVDGGFGNNDIFMHLMANAFLNEELFAASMAQATAVGTAIAIHKSWNKTPISGNIIELRFYPRNVE